MNADGTQNSTKFPDLISRAVVTKTDGYRVATDSGTLLIGQWDRGFGLSKRFNVSLSVSATLVAKT